MIYTNIVEDGHIKQHKQQQHVSEKHFVDSYFHSYQESFNSIDVITGNRYSAKGLNLNSMILLKEQQQNFKDYLKRNFNNEILILSSNNLNDNGLNQLIPSISKQLQLKHLIFAK